MPKLEIRLATGCVSRRRDGRYSCFDIKRHPNTNITSSGSYIYQSPY